MTTPTTGAYGVWMSSSGHGGLTWFTLNAPSAAVEYVTRDSAHLPMTCGHCSRDVSAAVLVQTTSESDRTLWLRCPHCGKGSVYNGRDGLAPGHRPGADLLGLPPEVASAYKETRDAASVGAWTATEMMCRKILMHVAVDKGARPGESFVSYLNHLETAGYVPAVMREWVEFIRKHGNEATHELPEVDKLRGQGTFTFTEQLLRSTYEMAALAAAFRPPPAE